MCISSATIVHSTWWHCRPSTATPKILDQLVPESSVCNWIRESTSGKASSAASVSCIYLSAGLVLLRHKLCKGHESSSTIQIIVHHEQTSREIYEHCCTQCHPKVVLPVSLHMFLAFSQEEGVGSGYIVSSYMGVAISPLPRASQIWTGPVSGTWAPSHLGPACVAHKWIALHQKPQLTVTQPWQLECASIGSKCERLTQPCQNTRTACIR